MPYTEQREETLEKDIQSTKVPQVLVVDDDTLVLKHIRRILQQGNLKYDGVTSAKEALLFLEHHEPDLILSDIQMPEMDGIEFCKRLREDPRYRDLPVVFLTGMSDMKTFKAAYAVGGNDYVVKPLRQVEVISRITHQIEEYRRIREAKTRIQNLNKQNEAKTKFLGVASHDLRNPLVSIRGISQYLESQKFGELNENQLELVQTMTRTSEMMLNLVEDLLDVSMFETGQIKIHPENTNLVDLIDTAVTLHSASAERKGMTIEKTVNASETTLDVDRKLITRVLDNLITNAIKFSPTGSKIELCLDSKSNDLNLIVQDNGPGIPEDQFNKLFKEFSRTTNQPTGGESSSGIGLYVCRKVMVSHGGDIRAENRREGGARFIATFKRRP